MNHRSAVLALLAAAVTGCAPAADDTEASFLLQFPIVERELLLDNVMGFDHDPESYSGFENIYCTNYDGEGYPLCYDDHSGTDFDLIDGFETMDAGSATVIAAADGEVVTVIDEHYDRCQVAGGSLEVDCNGHPMKANTVVIAHPSGYTTSYLHLMQDSAMVSVGDVVEAGTPLALVGSSGYSFAPHLHFGLESPEGEILDPYAGAFSQPDSYWCGQEDSDGFPAAECD